MVSAMAVLKGERRDGRSKHVRSVGGARLHELVEVLLDDVVEDGVVIAEVLEGEANVEVVLFVEEADALRIIFDLGVFQDLANELSARNKVLGRCLDNSEGGILGSAQLVHHLLLDANAKVVAVFNFWHIELCGDKFTNSFHYKVKSRSST